MTWLVVTLALLFSIRDRGGGVEVRLERDPEGVVGQDEDGERHRGGVLLHRRG